MLSEMGSARKGEALRDICGIAVLRYWKMLVRRYEVWF
jgi:hypothetical protein